MTKTKCLHSYPFCHYMETWSFLLWNAYQRVMYFSYSQPYSNLIKVFIIDKESYVTLISSLLTHAIQQVETKWWQSRIADQPAQESIMKLSSSTNFWIVLALAGDSTITRVIPSFAFSQMVAELIIFAFDLVANNLTLLVNDFRNSFMAWLGLKADTLIKCDSRKVIVNTWNVVSEHLFVIIPKGNMRRSLISLMLPDLCTSATVKVYEVSAWCP